MKVVGIIGQVEISLSLDLLAHEGGVPRYIYYNLRAAPADPDTARATLDIAHWILAHSGFQVPIRQLEYVDFANGNKAYRSQQRRARTIAKLKANAKLIEVVWPTL